jgi:predicted RNA-binding Zn ribbon-like protein
MPGKNFRFDLGRICLNLVATVGSRGSNNPIERLPGCSQLLDWLKRSGSISNRHALPTLTEADLESMIALRELLYRMVHDVVHARTLPSADLARLNAVAGFAHPPVPQLLVDEHRHLHVEIFEPVTLQQVQAMIARDAIDLLGGDERGLMRECAAHPCDGVYIDRSRGFRRQWCSSKTCGNQARVERFRSRAAAA